MFPYMMYMLGHASISRLGAASIGRKPWPLRTMVGAWVGMKSLFFHSYSCDITCMYIHVFCVGPDNDILNMYMCVCVCVFAEQLRSSSIARCFSKEVQGQGSLTAPQAAFSDRLTCPLKLKGFCASILTPAADSKHHGRCHQAPPDCKECLGEVLA